MIISLVLSLILMFSNELEPDNKSKSLTVISCNLELSISTSISYFSTKLFKLISLKVFPISGVSFTILKSTLIGKSSFVKVYLLINLLYFLFLFQSFNSFSIVGEFFSNLFFVCYKTKINSFYNRFFFFFF